MNILITCNGYPKSNEPNIYIFIHRQVKALKKYGHNVAVLDIDLRSFRWKRKYGIFWDTYEEVNVLRISFPFITVKFRWIYGWLNKHIAYFAMKKIEEKNGKISLICSHFVRGSGEAGAYLKNYFNLPFIIVEHSSSILKNVNEYIAYYLETYRKADNIIVVSEALKERLLQYNINSCVIPNVINTSLFYVDKNSNVHDYYTYLSVGNFIQGKRFDLTIKAFESIHKEHSKTRLILIGDGKLRASMIDLTTKLKITDIEFISYIPNNKMREMYDQCDCFVLPSDVETFGMVYAEAIACGIPVIATDNGGASDIVNKDNGLIIQKDNLTALQYAMEYMYYNSAKYNKTIMQEYIKDKFGEDTFVKQFNNCIKEIIIRKKENVL